MPYFLHFLQWRGQVLYEIHKPMMVKANRDYQTGNIKKEEFLNNLKNISCLLEESILFRVKLTRLRVCVAGM